MVFVVAAPNDKTDGRSRNKEGRKKQRANPPFLREADVQHVLGESKEKKMWSFLGLVTPDENNSSQVGSHRKMKERIWVLVWGDEVPVATSQGREDADHLPWGAGPLPQCLSCSTQATDEPRTLYNFQSSFYDAWNLSPSARQGFNANLSLLLWFQLT